MRSLQFRMPRHVSLKVAVLGCLFWGVAGSVAHSQDSPPPPTPHTRPILPGTHVPPRPAPQNPATVQQIDGSASVDQTKCAQQTGNSKSGAANKCR
jgi:hypothetical protein